MKKKIKKSAKKKVVKKVKKAAKKAVPSTKLRASKKVVKALPKRKPIGEVVHFFDKICVAVVKFNQGVAVGEEVCFEGPKGAFSQILNSMQYEHESIPKAKKGQEVGVKTKKPVREGHKVYRV
ncbi:MAG: hypothetical protein AAB626_01725 [Patescibacteria group bacterium]